VIACSDPNEFPPRRPELRKWMWRNGTGLVCLLSDSPGGADAIAIIAASSKVDVDFVMTMQTLRVVATLILGRTVTRLITAKAKSTSAVGGPTIEL
jgi:hypothetical protein